MRVLYCQDLLKLVGLAGGDVFGAARKGNMLMLEFIVLGQIPGTQIQVGFGDVVRLAIIFVVLIQLTSWLRVARQAIERAENWSQSLIQATRDHINLIRLLS